MTPHIAYRSIKFTPGRLAMIEQANEIIHEYQGQGFTLTVRQLYYQFVARGLSPNTMRDYKRIASLINDGRLAGEIDWHAIEDRTRSLQRLETWRDPAEMLDGVIYGYRTDLWASQDMRFEVWIEKEALAGVFEPICDELHVPFFCCRGYTSQSSMWEAAQRLIEHTEADQEVCILHFGDHDPSGIDMTRDIVDRLEEFGVYLNVNRMALNMDQVDEHTPPPNPTKLSDSRASGYVAAFGYESWELDALEPATLSRLVDEHVLAARDEEAWDEAEQSDEETRETFRAVSNHWAETVEFAQKLDRGAK